MYYIYAHLVYGKVRGVLFLEIVGFSAFSQGPGPAGRRDNKLRNIV